MKFVWKKIWLIIVLIVLIFTITPNLLLAFSLIKVDNILSLYNVANQQGYLINMTKSFLALYPDNYFKIIGIIFLSIDLKHYFLLVTLLLSFIINNKKIKLILSTYFISLFITLLIVVTQGIVLMDTLNITEVLKIINWLGYLLLISNIVVIIISLVILKIKTPVTQLNS